MNFTYSSCRLRIELHRLRIELHRLKIELHWLRIELHRLEVTSYTREISHMWRWKSNCTARSAFTKADFTYYQTTLTNFIRRQRWRVECIVARRLIRCCFPLRLVCTGVRMVSNSLAAAFPVFLHNKEERKNNQTRILQSGIKIT